MEMKEGLLFDRVDMSRTHPGVDQRIVRPSPVFADTTMPALILLTPRLRARRAWLIPAAALACCGVALNRYVQTVQTLALPTLSFDKFLSYTPSWQEVGT